MIAPPRRLVIVLKAVAVALAAVVVAAGNRRNPQDRPAGGDADWTDKPQALLDTADLRRRRPTPDLLRKAIRERTIYLVVFPSFWIPLGCVAPALGSRIRPHPARASKRSLSLRYT